MEFVNPVFDSKGKATVVLGALKGLIDKYGHAQVADLNDLIGETGVYSDRKWGWVDLISSKLEEHEGLVTLVLPKPVEFKSLERKVAPPADSKNVYSVHFGLDKDNLKILDKNPITRGAFIDGGWNSWSEKLGADTNDDRTYHMFIVTHDFPVIFHAIKELGLENLTPIQHQGLEAVNGALVVVTDSVDHSELIVYSKDLSFFSTRETR